ncbi:MAG: cobalamin-dependent protein [Gemmatimonadota bacterium]|nr:cobalamin-dependent protein [Gemmatimonadota bacterium]
MKILLVNPNLYRSPPVPPLGLEYLHAALKRSGHQSRILDLCFAGDPQEALERELERFGPQVAGLTVRNIDSALFQNNVFFLDGIKESVGLLKACRVPVILGGSGFSFYPEGVIEYLGADWGIAGPGEKAIVHLLDLCESGPPSAGAILNGWEWGIDPGLRIHGRGDEVDYGAYLAEGGIAGFETQKGCLGECSFCPESSDRVLFRSPGSVVDELEELVSLGIDNYHLCDSEFNQSLSYCHEFLETLISRRLSVSWALYMKTSPYDKELFRLLKASGAGLITLSVPSGPDDMDHVAEIRGFCTRYGIRLAVDFLCGFPGEGVEEVREKIERLRSIRPDTVGVNSYIRLFPGTAVTRLISSSREHRRYLTTDGFDGERSLIHPVFYNSITVEQLRGIIGTDPCFKIEGFERTTNYQRLQQAGDTP